MVVLETAETPHIGQERAEKGTTWGRQDHLSTWTLGHRPTVHVCTFLVCFRSVSFLCFGFFSVYFQCLERTENM